VSIAGAPTTVLSLGPHDVTLLFIVFRLNFNLVNKTWKNNLAPRTSKVPAQIAQVPNFFQTFEFFIKKK
jgi:hypothetical protein